MSGTRGDSGAPQAGAVEAGAIAGLAGLAAFLTLHHLLILPIWQMAPLGAFLAAGGGAAAGAAYGELRSHLPGAPWTPVVVVLGAALILGPAIVAGELTGPIYAMAPTGGHLLVPAGDAIVAFVGGLLATATLAGAVLGAVVGRTRSAAVRTAVAGFALALGPGHNIPMLGATAAVPRELAILAVVVLVSAITLVASQALLGRRPTRSTPPTGRAAAGPWPAGRR
jgi:hypothetical protein